MGKGACYRPFETSRRNDKWYEVVASTGAFEVEIAGWFETDQEARRVETIEIKHHCPIANLMQNGLRRTDEFKLFISQLHTGKTNSERTRAKISDAMQGRPAWNKGISPTSDHRDKLRKSANKRAITEVISGRTFESIHEAARSLGIEKANIGCVLRGAAKTVKGMEFRYAE